MGEILTFDICAGNPMLPDVTDETFTPARTSTYLGLLVDFGWLDADSAASVIDQLGEDPFAEPVSGLPI